MIIHYSDAVTLALHIDIISFIENTCRINVNMMD